MLYHTYRPQTIAELDNTKVKITLRKLLETTEIPHAYLFVGQKGMGKTSTARIFAKAVNCLENKFAGKSDSVEPCNKCSNCIAISSDTSPDVAEQDAGARGLKEEMLNLISEASYSPLVCRYRVYILDEAHMITTQAFNALLKTLEEPPAHVIFILATTNEEKIPRTIISRCIRVSFGKATAGDIRGMLDRVVAAEKVTFEGEVLDFIANHSENSFRDATKMLEEIIGQGFKTADEVRGYFGLRSKESLVKILESGDLKQAIVWIAQFKQSGGSAKALIEETLQYLQQVLFAKSGVTLDPDNDQLGSDMAKSKLTSRDLGLLIRLFTESYGLLKISPDDALPLEIAVLEYYNARTLPVKNQT